LSEFMRNCGGIEKLGHSVSIENAKVGDDKYI